MKDFRAKIPFRSTAKRQLQGSVWPSGDFSVGIGYNNSMEPVEPPYKPVKRSQPCSGAETEGGVDGGLTYVQLMFGEADPGEASPCPDTSESPETLGSSDVPKSHRLPRGASGITSYGRKMLKSCVTLLQEKHGKENLTFATFTLPQEEGYVWADLPGHWPELLRQFLQAVSRKLHSRLGFRPEIVYCTEVQQKRLQGWGGIPLHLHLVVCGRNPNGGHACGGWALRAEEYRALWRSACVRVAGFSPHTSFDASENVQRVKKDVAAYLGKYLSKGITGDAAGFRLASWWGASLSIRREVKSRVVKLPSALKFLWEHIVYTPWAVLEGVRNLFPVSYRIDGAKIPWGFCGQLTGDFRSTIEEIRDSYLTEMLKSPLTEI